MDQSHPVTDPDLGRPIELQLHQFSASEGPHALAGSPSVCADLDRYDIAVVLKATYEWGGYRYTNAADAIAAAKRGL